MRSGYRLYRVQRGRWKCMICGKIKKRKYFRMFGQKPADFCKSCEQKLGGPNSCRRELHRQFAKETIDNRFWKDRLIAELEIEE